jgi:hypothetical protein
MNSSVIRASLVSLLTLAPVLHAQQAAPRDTVRERMIAARQAAAGGAKPAPASKPTHAPSARPVAKAKATPTAVVASAAVAQPAKADSTTPAPSAPVSPAPAAPVVASAPAAPAQPAPTAPAQPKPAAPAPAKPAAASAAAASVGFGTIKFDGLLQAWYTDGARIPARSFRVRRVELKMSGQVAPTVSWAVMLDAAKSLSVSPTYVTVNGTKVLADASVAQSGRVLQDAFVTVDLPWHAHVDAGQIKIPLSNMGFLSSGKLETVERPMFVADKARGASFGDVRDVGAMIRGSATRYADYFLGAFNGSGESQNNTDKDPQKAWIGRVVFRPLVPGLQLGGSGVYGGKPNATHPRRDRLGGEAQYTWHALMTRAEFMRGSDAAVNRIGYYVMSTYKLRPTFDLVARFDAWDPDRNIETGVATDVTHDILGGFNWYLAGQNAKLQLNYNSRTYKVGTLPSEHQILVNLQTSW